MQIISADEEKEKVDYVTGAMFSLSFVYRLSSILFDPNKNNVSIKKFYDDWLTSLKATENKIPFNPGVFVGYLFCGLIITKENWFTLLPEASINDLESDWGLQGVKCSLGESHPGLPDFIRRIRNSLGHSNFAIATRATSVEDLMEGVTVKFYDVNARDVKDVFEVELTMKQLVLLVRKFQSVIHRHVRSQMPSISES